MAVNRCKGDMAALKKTVDSEKNRKDGPLFAEIYAGLCSATGQEQEAERYYRFASDSYSPQRDKLRAEIQLAYTLKALERADDAAEVAKAYLLAFVSWLTGSNLPNWRPSSQYGMCPIQ